MENYVIGYRKIDEKEYNKIQQNKFIINQPDYISSNVYKIKNNINYIFFFENCNQAIKLIESTKKSYIMKCNIPTSLIEKGKGYYYTSYLFPEFKVNRKAFKSEYIESIAPIDKIPNQWLNDEEYKELIKKSQTVFFDFPIKEEINWKNELKIDNLNMYLPNENEYSKRYGRSPEEYLIRGIYNYGLENIKKIINLEQSDEIKKDILRSISDLVVGTSIYNNMLTELYIYENEGYEFAKILLENESKPEKIKSLKKLKALGFSNEQIKKYND